MRRRTCSSWRRWRCCCSLFAEWSVAWRGLILALGVVLLVARLASAWGLSHSLEQGSARKAGAGLTSLVVVACSLLVLYRMLVVL